MEKNKRGNLKKVYFLVSKSSWVKKIRECRKSSK